jgi:hypothetical protein
MIFKIRWLGLYIAYTWVIFGFRRGVKETFALLGYYAVLIGSYRRFGTIHRRHLQGPWTA